MSNPENPGGEMTTNETERPNESIPKPNEASATIKESKREPLPFPMVGKVALIINERELAINLGEEHGVEEGMRFAVLAASPIEVRDPDTNEFLGSAPREKVRVEAVDVQERMTICATYETRVVGGQMGFPDMTGMFAPQRRVPRTLRAATDSYPAPLSAKESYVRIGDVVQELSGFRSADTQVQ
jgi:hypothetical protein